MKKIDFHEPTTKNWTDWRKSCAAVQKKHTNAVKNGNKSIINEKLYKGGKYNIKSDIYLSSNGPFRGKCAYCEQVIHGNQHGDIEHFRPKNAVSDIDWNPIKVLDNNGNSIDHPGYYWLVYDSNNLLPSCIQCNQKTTIETENGTKVIGKHTRFPIEGGYATLPGQENSEQPLLINPIEQDPSEHIEIFENGVLAGKSNRGRACIEVFGLNYRDLPGRRRNIYKSVRDKMGLLSLLLIADPNSGQVRELIEELLEIKSGKGEFTSIALKAINDAKANSTPLQAI